jgi:FkbM family methyltransferase
MSVLSSAARRVVWLARRACRQPARSVAEEVWRLRYLNGIQPRQPGIGLWRGQPLHYRDAPALLGQLHEIFVQGAYDFTPATTAPRIIDCGAHVGVAVLRWRELFPDADVTALEADPDIASALRQNLATRGDSRTRVLAAAAWTADGEIGFHFTGADDGHVDAAAPRRIPARDLAELCDEPVDLLKLDIEGAEDAVLAHLDATGALRRVRRLVCEWHQWTPAAPRLHLALARLVAAGFVYRLASASCLGRDAAPGFPRLAWAGNHVLFYAWREPGSPA